MSEVQYKDPVRNINQEYLQGLEVLSNKEFPLPGSRCRGGETDARFTHLKASDPSRVPEVTLFNHMATIRHRSSGMTYVVFKKTMDALHLEQQDLNKYPSWLMDSNVKKTELDIYIHSVKPPYHKNPKLVTNDHNIVNITAQTRIHKWLDPINTAWVFDTVAYFLLKNNIITQEMYGKIS